MLLCCVVAQGWAHLLPLPSFSHAKCNCPTLRGIEGGRQRDSVKTKHRREKKRSKMMGKEGVRWKRIPLRLHQGSASELKNDSEKQSSAFPLQHTYLYLSTLTYNCSLNETHGGAPDTHQLCYLGPYPCPECCALTSQDRKCLCVPQDLIAQGLAE